MPNTPYAHLLTSTTSSDADPSELHMELVAAYDPGQSLEGAPSFLGLNYNTPVEGELQLWFDDALDAGQQTAATNVVTAHNGTFPGGIP